MHDTNIYGPWSWCMCVWCIYLWSMTLIMIYMSMIFDPWPWCIYACIHDANLYDPWSWCMCVWCRYEWCLYPWSRTLMHVPLMRDFFVSEGRTNERTDKAILGVGSGYVYRVMIANICWTVDLTHQFAHIFFVFFHQSGLFIQINILCDWCFLVSHCATSKNTSLWCKSLTILARVGHAPIFADAHQCASDAHQYA